MCCSIHGAKLIYLFYIWISVLMILIKKNNSLRHFLPPWYQQCAVPGLHEAPTCLLTGKVNFKVRKYQSVCEPLVLICFIHFFCCVSKHDGGAVFFFTWSCIVVRQTRFYWRHLNMQDGRYLKVCWALDLSYPDDGLLCCVSALSLVWPLCLLHYISKSHRPTCAAMTASIKGTTSCESMMRVSMWHLCTINLTTPSQPITQRRPLCLLAFGGVLCWRRDCVKPSLHSTVWFLIFLPTELGANQSVTELAVSRGQKPISAVNPLVLLMCCLNSLLQTDWVSSVSELLTPSRSHTAASDCDDAPALYFHGPSKSRDVV